MEWSDTAIFQYLNSIYNTIVLKDIITRQNIRNVRLLENIVEFVFDNIGNIFSVRSISNFLKSPGRSADHETVRNYLSFLEAAFLIHCASRFDMKGKQYLEFFDKFFVGDIGLRHSVLGYRDDDISGLLENLVFLKLKQKGYRIFVGKIEDLEIDFIAEKDKKRLYIQVSYLLSPDEVVQREINSLLKIKDNYPKYILSLNPYGPEDYKGIQHINAMNFLADKV